MRCMARAMSQGLGTERPGSGLTSRYPPRRHEELELWEISPYSRGKFKTVHRAGQLDVRKNKVYRISGSEMLHGLIGVARLNHPHARVAQFLGDRKPDQEFVLDHERGANMLGRSAPVTYHREPRIRARTVTPQSPRQPQIPIPASDVQFGLPLDRRLVGALRPKPRSE